VNRAVSRSLARFRGCGRTSTLFPSWFDIALSAFGILPIRPETLSALLLVALAGGLLVLLGRRAPGLFGIATGFARERTGSVATPILLHWFALATWLACAGYRAHARTRLERRASLLDF